MLDGSGFCFRPMIMVTSITPREQRGGQASQEAGWGPGPMAPSRAVLGRICHLHIQLVWTEELRLFFHLNFGVPNTIWIVIQYSSQHCCRGRDTLTWAPQSVVSSRSAPGGSRWSSWRRMTRRRMTLGVVLTLTLCTQFQMTSGSSKPGSMGGRVSPTVSTGWRAMMSVRDEWWQSTMSLTEPWRVTNH